MAKPLFKADHKYTFSDHLHFIQPTEEIANTLGYILL